MSEMAGDKGTYSPVLGLTNHSMTPSGSDRSLSHSGYHPSSRQFSAGPGTSSNPNSNISRRISRAASSGTTTPNSQYDPHRWDMRLCVTDPEDDDNIHNPESHLGRRIFSARGIANLGCLGILLICILGLFVGYPVSTAFTTKRAPTFGVNSTGQVSQVQGNFGLVDNDTPQDARTIKSYEDGSEWTLIFSDEFNMDGRTFWPGDDPYFEAVDLNYWETGDLNWYDPSAITTKNGALEITFSENAEHGFNYTGGLMSTWNKFCFTGGMVQASVQLPGQNDVSGLWPSVWTLGELGRVGYGATFTGLWPYSYDDCDLGTLANQTLPGEDPPVPGLSQLPGQRLSSCTCPGEDHPGPVLKDGTFPGRSAPEIDLFEGQIQSATLTGSVSQSAQWAPFNYQYQFNNDSSGLKIYNSDNTFENTYIGGPLQQATSYVSGTNQSCYELDEACFATYAIEYKPGYEADNAYLTWVNNGEPSWTLYAAGMGADDTSKISARPISQEPMYIIANLGMSSSFSFLDFASLKFPAVMRIDWIRVYQPSNAINYGCDPADYPTQDYINRHAEAYNNPNLTQWTTAFSGYNQTFPKNKLVDSC